MGCFVTQENASDMLKVGIYWSQICVELLKAVTCSFVLADTLLAMSV